MFARFRLLFASFCVLLGLTPWAQAQNPTPTPAPVQMSVSSPFALTQKPLLVSARPGRWFPIAVTLTNTGDPVSGEVRLTLAAAGGNFNNPPNDFYTKVDLPSNSRKVIWLYGRVERPEINAPDFEIDFSGRGFPALSLRGQTRPPDDGQKVVCIASASATGLDDTLRSIKIQAVTRPGTNFVNTGQSPVRPIEFGPEMIPDRWIGFDGADLVVLGNFPHIALSPTQLDALRGYVMGGGTMVAMGGSNAARMASSPLKDLWAQQPTTSVAANNSEVSELVSRYVPNPQNGGDRLGGAPVVVTRGSLSPAAVLVDGSTTAPLFSMLDSGAGRTIFLSYDPSMPPFKGWSGQGLLWREVFSKGVKARPLETISASYLADSMNPNTYGGYGTAPGYPGGYGGYGSPFTPPTADSDSTSSTTDALVDALGKAPQLRMPPVSQIAWFLALYVFFLVPLNYAVLRFFDKRELAWITIPVIVTVFSVLAYREALSIRGRAILTRQLDIVQTSIGSNAGRVDSMLWLFSPRSTTYTLVSKGTTGIVADFVDKRVNQGAFSIAQPADGSGFIAESAPVGMWSDRAFVAQSLGALGRGLQLNGRTLKNTLGFDVQGAVWIQDGRVASLGTIIDGGSVIIPALSGQQYGAQLPGVVTRASHLDKIFDTSTITGGIPTGALNVALGNRFGVLNQPPILIGWTKSLVAPLDIGLGDTQSRDITLLVVRVPKLSAQIASTEAFVSRTSFEPFTSSNQQYNPNVGGYAYYDCQLPANSNLTLVATGTGAGRRQTTSKNGKSAPLYVHFEVMKTSSGDWQSLPGTFQLGKTSVGTWKFTATIDPSWPQQPDRLLRVRVKLDNSVPEVSTLSVR